VGAVKYLLDTDTCISLLDSREPEKQERILRRLDRTAPTDVALSTITVSELAFGVENSRFRKANAAALDTFLLDFSILPFDEKASRETGKVRAELEKRGQRIGVMDTMIAAHARSLAMTVVTNNTVHFSKVGGLKVENWSV
jgi:tRNA(fMet)-specific endonuclease VapC